MPLGTTSTLRELSHSRLEANRLKTCSDASMKPQHHLEDFLGQARPQSPSTLTYRLHPLRHAVCHRILAQSSRTSCSPYVAVTLMNTVSLRHLWHSHLGPRGQRHHHPATPMRTCRSCQTRPEGARRGKTIRRAPRECFELPRGLRLQQAATLHQMCQLPLETCPCNHIVRISLASAMDMDHLPITIMRTLVYKMVAHL